MSGLTCGCHGDSLKRNDCISTVLALWYSCVVVVVVVVVLNE
jgi:hypothetical protein